MKIGLISDIHGNIVALDAVLQSLELQRIDKIVCLGDVAATGPRPHEALERLRGTRALCVMGNTDEWLLKPARYENAGRQLKMIEEVDLWCSGELTNSDKEFLHSFKAKIAVPLGDGMTLLAFHGSPKSYNDWISSTESEEALEVMLSGEKATIMAGGHSHRQMLRRYKDTILINSGSVGLPFERYRTTGKVRVPPWSEFAIISKVDDTLDVSFKRVNINFEEVVRSILESEMPHRETFLEGWTSYIEILLNEHNLT